MPVKEKYNITPAYGEFAANCDAGKGQLVWTKIIADSETPVSIMRKLYQEDEPCFLLESVEGGEVRGRYSIIGIDPDLLWRCRGNESEICRDASSQKYAKCEGDTISSLKSLIAESKLDMPKDLPSMSAGLIGYMGYDMIKLVEDIPSANIDTINIPDSCLMRPQITIIFDARDGVVYIVTPVWKTDENIANAELLYQQASDRVLAIIAKISQPLDNIKLANGDLTSNSKPLNFQPNITRTEFHDMVEKIKSYIVAGDIFQCVPSQRFSADFASSPLALYRALRYMNPSPFLFYLHLDDFSLVGSSPEILVRVRDDKITIRPIAGTRKRGKTIREDSELEQELLADPKELAEHLMLLDLGRNDVGKCAKTGTVTVTEQMFVEKYSHVMHIVSNVEGEIDDKKYDAFDALMAGFPAGTVSGAPKIRAMEIIDEIEPEKRSFYAGCVGYFSASGSMDSCITLRTGLIKDGKLYAQAGGGVVADSVAELEYQESLNKAKAIMRAAEIAHNFE